MKFSEVVGLVIPKGEVTKIAKGTSILWERIEDSGGRIPAEYQEVEWIQSNANNGGGASPYLDLGFAFDTKARIEMSIYQQESTSGYIFGSAENSGKLRCMLTSPNNGTASNLFYGSTGSSYISVNPTLNHPAWNEFEFTLEQGNLRAFNKTNGSDVSKNTQGSYTMTNNLYLFSQNYNGSARFSGTNRISAFKYYDKTGTLICDLVPCYKKNDKEIGMYDMVRNIFLSNVNPNSTPDLNTNHLFTKGADVVYS